MALKINKFEKMIRGDSIDEQEFYKKELINEIKYNELEGLKLLILVNSINHIKDDVLKEKCLDIVTHYRLFKNDESNYNINELSDSEKDTFAKCIGDCTKKECTRIIKEKDSIPTDLLKLLESEPIMTHTIKTKLNSLLFLLNKFTNNKIEINKSLDNLLDSSNVVISEAKLLTEQVDFIKVKSHKLQNDIITKTSCSKELFKALENYYYSKKKEYETSMTKLNDLQNLQDKYKQVDGPQYRALVKKFIQTKEMIKIKTQMFNNF